jgi:hypothetical protein
LRDSGEGGALEFGRRRRNVPAPMSISASLGDAGAEDLRISDVKGAEEPRPFPRLQSV